VSFPKTALRQLSWQCNHERTGNYRAGNGVALPLPPAGVIEQAITHSSQAREQESQQTGENKYRVNDNEQLEFLGDAILALGYQRRAVPAVSAVSRG